MELRNSIEERGFAIEIEVFADEVLDRLLVEIDQLAPRRSRAGIRHALGLAPVATLSQSPLLIDRAREILGASAFPYRATLFDKSPASNWLVVWHQDTALPLCSRNDSPGWGPWSIKEGIHYAHAPARALEQVLTLRVHLDDSTSGNGPLRVLPETHTLGVLSDDRIHDLSCTIGAVDCVAPKAGSWRYGR